MKVLKFPLAKITICFITGVLTAYNWQPDLFLINSAVILLLLTFSVSYLLSGKNSKFTIFFTITAYLISFFIGCLTLLFHTASFQKTNYTNCKKAYEKPQNITLCLREKLKGNDYNERYIALINQIENQNYSGRIIINIQKDSLPDRLIIGNIIRLKTTLQNNPSPKNPNQFDYGKYLKDKQIYAQIYATKSELSINKKFKKDIWYYNAKLHTRIVNNLTRNDFNQTEMNVALALILGQRQEISPEIVQDYQFSGATHILSVSGLHVGFIMLFITFILKPIGNTPKGSFIKLIAILTSLILFAIISGLSPCVLRSVVMFSFLAIGNYLHRSDNTYHTLLVSILLILLFEPYFLFDIGFQLSYLALFFILWLQPLLKNLWIPKNKIVLNLWNVLTVSFAAQIGTLPLCLYYFHQFPGLFFVTNIVIIPILTFIMIAGILVMILAVFNIAPLFLIQILEKSIYLLNKIIHYVASFDSFVIKNISFNNYYLFAFYLWIIISIIWVKRPNYFKLTGVLISVIILQLSSLFTKKNIQSQHEIIVYNIKKKTIISERNGENVTFFCSDDFFKASSKNNILNSYLVGNFSHLKKKTKIKNTLYFNNKKIFILDSSGVYQKKTQPDILLLTQSPKINLNRIINNLHPKIIIADASNSYSIQKYWKATCLKQKIPFHATNEKGYYKLLN
ncbi:ComEC/Rec2 family competence protein [Flavobacterium pectinovorum]|uniref:ComEC/Rec2 family competence protein n=1 Tax=Flavobacterium pectinovorum TaxID=29533 RepID=UPI001FABBD57|nr:ComEC/Rec2 family competence protein [Flavobacterium pectinovorum]MCI9845160.1 ComEC/Rec2 family competence protein [Flavobacterium pectinovorum]